MPMKYIHERTQEPLPPDCLANTTYIAHWGSEQLQKARTLKQEFQFRFDQAITWAANISKNPLSRAEVFTAFSAMWSPAIDYPLAFSTSFSSDKCSTAYSTCLHWRTVS